MTTVFDFRKEIYKDYPHCVICDSGNIASNDCPNCHSKILGWYQRKLDILINEKQEKLDYAKIVLDQQTEHMKKIDYDD